MIGIIGGYGSIGLEAAKILTDFYQEEIIIAGSNPEGMGIVKQSFFEGTKKLKVDIFDKDSVERLFHQCNVVVNCSGVSLKDTYILDYITENDDIKYTDLGNDIASMLKSKVRNSCIVLAAGSLPGLSALMPRYLALQIKGPHKLKFSYDGLGRFTYTAAREYLEGLFQKDKYVMVALKNGRIEPVNSENFVNDNAVTEKRAVSYFDKESEFIAKELQLEEGIWNMIIGGEHTLQVLYSAREQYKKDPEGTIKALSDATVLDLLYCDPYVEMQAELSGITDKKLLSVTAKAPEILTGAMAAVTAHLLKENKLPKGIFTLGECADVAIVMEQLFFLHKYVDIEVADSLGEI